MRILQLSMADIGPGSEQVAWRLHQQFREAGHRSVLAVAKKHTDDPDVASIPRSTAARVQYRAGIQVPVGLADAAWVADNLGMQWDGILVHNLAAGYFAMSGIQRLADAVPTVAVLHDRWLLSGHCAHPMGCERWRDHCGRCPDLTLPPSVRFDWTRLNLHRKRRALGQSKLAVSSPGAWLLDLLPETYLAGSPARRIHNPVDLEVFKPLPRAACRNELGLPAERPIVFFPVFGGVRKAYKDADTLLGAMAQLGQQLGHLDVLLMAIGSPDDALRSVPHVLVPPVSDPAGMARYYGAADVVAHPTTADTSPLAVAEAMAAP
jgi:glycosyltransferase involved in cell wall biosynthesis